MRKRHTRNKEVLDNKAKKKARLKVRRNRKKKLRAKQQRITEYLGGDRSEEKRVVVRAPENFTLGYDYVEKVLRFIEDVKKASLRKGKVFIDLSGVKVIGEGAISMLLSVIREISSGVEGNKPINNVAKNILERSGFFKHMNGRISDINANSKNIILTTGGDDTDQKVVSSEIHRAMDTVWGTEGRNPMLYGGIGEMLRNSCDHAFEAVKDIKWHLGISHDEKKREVKFSFVDNGDGILNTYYQKGFFSRVRKAFKNDADFLETAFFDGIQSRTGLAYRGKGLPHIYELYKEDVITNLVVVTNKVYIDFDKGISRNLKAEFSGTYYFWSISQKCRKLNYPISA